MNKKQKIVIVLSFIVLLIFTGCSGGSFMTIKGDIEASENGLSGQYKQFNGNYYKKAKFEKGDIITFSVKVNTVKGNLSFKLIDSEGEIVSELEDGKSIEIEKNDVYKVQVEGSKHEGGFIVSWSEE